MENIKPFEDKVLSPRETDAKSYDIPYILDFYNNNSALYFIGTGHMKDKSNSIFNRIEKDLKNFVFKHKNTEICLCLESFIPERSSRADIIENYGETGFLSYLGYEHNLEMVCPEPGKDHGFRKLLESQNYRPIDIASWLFLNVLSSTLGNHNSVSKEKLPSLYWAIDFSQHLIDQSISASDILNNINLLTKLELPDSLPNFTKKSFEPMTIRKFHSPYHHKSVLNDIGNDLNHLRDKYITKKILELLNQNKKIFTVFGVNHAVAQEPAYEAYFATKNGA
jgi:hypothetical protein